MLLNVSEGDFCPIDIGLQLTYNILYGLCHCLEDWLGQAQCIECVTILAVVAISVNGGAEGTMLLDGSPYDVTLVNRVGTIMGDDIIDDVSHMYITIVQ